MVGGPFGNGAVVAFLRAGAFLEGDILAVGFPPGVLQLLIYKNAGEFFVQYQGVGGSFGFLGHLLALLVNGLLALLCELLLQGPDLLLVGLLLLAQGLFVLARLFRQGAGFLIHGHGQRFVFGFFLLDQLAELLAAVQCHVGVLQVVPELFDVALKLA